jgi:hypothetical protein
MTPIDRSRAGLGRTLRLALLAGMLALAGSVSPALAASPGGQGQATLAAVRAATATYHDLAVAKAAGYGLFPGCFAHPEGGMGVHYVQFPSVGDGRLDPLDPEALVYEPLAGGGQRLVAVEYIVIASTWHQASPPSVLGHPLEFVTTPNEFGLPDFYELHVWLWQPNPSGMFTEWNPLVSCDAVS